MTVQSFDELEEKLNALISGNILTQKTLLNVLSLNKKTTFFSDNPKFIKHINNLYDILFADVDGDGKLTVKDLRQTIGLINNDIKDQFSSVENLLTLDTEKVGIRLLENLILMITELKGSLKFNAGELELILFQLLAHSLIIKLPSENEVKLSPYMTGMLLKILLNLFKYYRSIDAVKKATQNIEKYINHTLSFCCCCSSDKVTVSPYCKDKAVKKFMKSVTRGKNKIDLESTVKRVKKKDNSRPRSMSVLSSQDLYKNMDSKTE